MEVPSDCFQGKSPERYSAERLKTFFTFVSARIVLHQLEGSGRGNLGAYNAAGYTALKRHLQDVPVVEGDAWVKELLAIDQEIGLRVMEVRKAYCSSDFQWQHLQKLAARELQEANVKLMKDVAEAALTCKQAE